MKQPDVIQYIAFRQHIYASLICVLIIIALTLKQQETHGCVVSNVATDALVLKHQAISIHNAD